MYITTLEMYHLQAQYTFGVPMCCCGDILMKQLVINFVSAVDCHNVQLYVIPLRMAHRIRTGLLVNSICSWKRINTQYVTIHNISFTFKCFQTNKSPRKCSAILLNQKLTKQPKFHPHLNCFPTFCCFAIPTFCYSF